MKIFKQNDSPKYLLFILFLISVVNYLDRQVLSIVQEDVKGDLGLTDEELGRLVLAFGLMHALLAIPIGRLADKNSRKRILTICLAIWSAFTAAGGFVQNYVQLFLARLGVGLGEAGVTPTTYSIVSDKFPINKRATALGVLAVGVPIGSMFSYILGGQLAESVGWRWTFILFGLPGLFIAVLLVLTVKAPSRGSADNIKNLKESSFGDTFNYLFFKSRSFLFVLLGAMFGGLVGYSVLSWVPSYYIREFGLTKSEVGLSFGMVVGGVGLVTIMLSSYTADKLGERDLRWYTWITAALLTLCTPFFYYSIMVDSFQLSLILFGIGTFFSQGTLGIMNSLIQTTSPVQMRGVASASKTTAMSFFGYGLGGYLVGVLSDYFSQTDAENGLKTALAVIMIFNILAAICFIIASFSLKKDVAAAQAYSENTNTQ